MMLNDLCFSVNQYDSDGDVSDYCVLLHVNESVTLRFKDSDSLEEFANKIKDMLEEIRENEQRLS